MDGCLGGMGRRTIVVICLGFLYMYYYYCARSGSLARLLVGVSCAEHYVPGQCITCALECRV
jgi:hypothetical protein